MMSTPTIARRAAVRTSVAALAGAAGLLIGAGVAANADPVSLPQFPAATQADEQPAGSSDTVFTDNPHLVDSQPLAFRTWSRLEDANAVRVHFTAGTPQCFGAHATVQETDDTVQVALSTGSLPGSANRMCTVIGVLGALDVPLSRPLGDREVVSAT